MVNCYPIFRMEMHQRWHIRVGNIIEYWKIFYHPENEWKFNFLASKVVIPKLANDVLYFYHRSQKDWHFLGIHLNVHTKCLTPSPILYLTYDYAAFHLPPKIFFSRPILYLHPVTTPHRPPKIYFCTTPLFQGSLKGMLILQYSYDFQAVRVLMNMHLLFFYHI